MSEPVRFSIIVPTYGRPEKMLQCLRAFAALDYPCDRFEVLVVDDGSPQFVATYVKPADYPFAVRVLRQHRQGPGIARNFGAAAALGSLLAFTDDDCTVAPGWLHAFDAANAIEPAGLLGGSVKNACINDLFAETNQFIYEIVDDWFALEVTALRFFTSNSLCCSADRFQNIGGFSRLMVLAAGEDREFSMRWVRLGGTLRKVPDAILFHHHSQNVAKFTEMHFRYGRGASILHRILRTNVARYTKPGLYWRLLAAPFFRRVNGPAWLVCLLIVWSQAMIGAGYLFQQWRFTQSRSNDLSSSRT